MNFHTLPPLVNNSRKYMIDIKWTNRGLVPLGHACMFPSIMGKLYSYNAASWSLSLWNLTKCHIKIDKIKLGYRNWGNFAKGGNWTFSLIINQKSAGQDFSGNCLFQVSWYISGLTIILKAWLQNEWPGPLEISGSSVAYLLIRRGHRRGSRPTLGGKQAVHGCCTPHPRSVLIGKYHS